MTEDIAFITKHKKKGALLDANVLLVYLVGIYDMRRMRSFSHTQQYADDFPLVDKLVKTFPVIYTTPNVLTEVSNLGGKLGDGFYDVLQLAIPRLKEQYGVSEEAAKHSYFNKIGLTDCALVDIARAGVLVISIDSTLCRILRSKNIDAVNFNHLRQLSWNGLI